MSPTTQTATAARVAPAAVLAEMVPAEGPCAILNHHLHGWFFRTLERVDPARATALHTVGRRKPFTIWAGPRFSLGAAGATPDPDDLRRHWLRITVLAPDVAPLVERALRLDREIRLGRASFEVSRWTADATVHPWAGISPYDELSLEADRNGPGSRRVRLRFLTPTAFSGDASPTLFPHAKLVFTSLMKSWNTHSGCPVPPEIERELIGAVREEAHAVRTAGPVSFGRFFLNGFVGDCEYSLGAKASVEAQRTLHVLTRYAFFSGVGLKTTMGMGQVIGEPA